MNLVIGFPVFMLLNLLGVGTMVHAQTAFEGSEPLVQKAELNAKSLEAFLDRLVPKQLDSNHIQGAAIAVVKDGQLLLAKGYGYANLENKSPVVAEKTLFRTGSVAKLFTWTAVMQLVEQGRLDLDADINTYLETFQIPATYPAPITLRHLLTHTAGFEDSVFGVLAKDASKLVALSEFTPKHIPARVYPPGQVTAYSNFGVTLAGYIVEKTSGMRFEDYVQRQLFQRLGMTRTTFTQPLPQNLAADLATGYTYQKSSFVPHLFEYYQIAPAGSSSTTVSDMARFMLAFLQGGELDDNRVLTAATVQTMLTPQFANDPRLSAFGLGFYQMPFGGHRVWGHKGETDFFRTLLALLPEHKLGIYMAFNAPGGSAAGNVLMGAMLEHFFSKPASKPAVKGFEELRPLAGLYAPTRRPQTTLEKITQLLLPIYRPIRVRQVDAGVIELSLPTDPTSRRWFNTASQVFQREDGKDTAVLKDGYLFLDSVAPKGYQQLGWLEQLFFQPWFPLLCLVGLIAAAAMVRVALPAQTHPYGYWLALSAAVLAVGFAAGLVAYVVFGMGGLAFGTIPPMLKLLLLVPLAVGLLALGAGAVALVPQWGGGVLMRSGLGLTAVTSAAFLCWLYYWKLLGLP